MSDTPKKGLEEPEAAYLREEEEGTLTDAEWEAWYKRNGEALQASFKRADEEYERGEYYTIEEVMARVYDTIKRVAKKP
jgi:hypothetical protein